MQTLNDLLCVRMITYNFPTALQFRLRSASDKRCPSFTYTTPPGVVATPLEWKMCCEPGSDIPSEHVTYHQLSASDESLTAVVDEYITTESNIIGLIVINSTASRYLSENILDKTTPPQLPVYVVSLEGGTQIEGFVSQQKEGDVQVKVLVESTVDSLPVGLPVQVPAAASTGPLPPPVTSMLLCANVCLPPLHIQYMLYSSLLYIVPRVYNRNQECRTVY